MKNFFLLAFSLFLLNNIYSQGKSRNPVHFCNTNNHIVFDSLSKCAELFPNEPGLKIMSFVIKFEVLPGQMKTYNILGSALTPEVIKLFTEYKKSVNVVDIEGIVAEKEGQFIKLPPARFLFFF